MNLIVCIDKDNGLMFNGRRQSQDRVVREKILSLCDGAKVWMNAYSAKQFEDVTKITIAEDFLLQAKVGAYVFVEDGQLPEPSSIERVFIFHWNRKYPADVYFTLDLKTEGFRKKQTMEFVGSSHDRITMDVYERKTT